ncbi:uncharacterized protein LOC109852128 isoform X3 [Pseudomyrmex gracilis]|uniref:uncharacterized protein LOC109852128 isoform X3 n=1 Tax=Pseudomyrmex gracilis TaxID=219809 RepID=UPI0009952297|nr:uncharacterized protein LOC109852128 isoform X3 [Pseudomyrmex gracilis]
MRIRSQQLGLRGKSMKTSTQEGDYVNLENMARFQQKQLQEKEQKLLQLYDQQQQRAYQVVQKGSAGSNGSNHGSTVRTTTTTHTTSTSQGGKVRQMFDERRQTTVKGIDRSYPLEPLENRLRRQANGNVTTQRNGNSTTVNRQSVSVRRVARADVNSNVNGGKPVVTYHEEIARESFGPSARRHDDVDEFDVENRVSTFANGHYRHDDNEHEDVLDHDTIDRNRMMAKIHLMGFDETLKNRVRNDLESEEFPDYLMVDVPEKLPKRNVTKKLSQAEARLERFKNANAKRSNMTKQSNPTSTVIKKRSEQIVPARSNSGITKSPSPDPAARKHETNTRAIRGSASSSLSKSPDIPSRRASTELKNQDAKPSRKSVTAKGADLTGGKGAGTFDAADGVANDSPHESATKKSSAFVIDFNGSSKEDDTMPSRKPPMRKTFSDKQQITPNTGRSSSSSNSSVSLSQVSSAKDKMISRARTSAGDLVACKTCGRHFAQDRVSLHQQICEKTLKKERKKFDTVLFRTRGTDLEPFVKKGFVKKQEAKSKKQSPTKPDWRRKHEEFISAIRYAKQAQAYQAAGKDLRDLPPPPPSDTSDYIQCPHCNRKFNQAAAERHIPKCKDMQHNKPRSLRTRR